MYYQYYGSVKGRYSYSPQTRQLDVSISGNVLQVYWEAERRLVKDTDYKRTNKNIDLSNSFKGEITFDQNGRKVSGNFGDLIPGENRQLTLERVY